MGFNSNQDAYIDLRNIMAERTASVVAWVGSGLSIAAGLPTWGGLRKALTDAFRSSITTFEETDQKKQTALHRNIEKEEDHWQAFQMLEEALGSASFKEKIRQQLQITPKVAAPAAYSHLWELGISGLLNLNLDRLATRAYTANSTIEPLEFSGFQIANVAHILKNPHPFILNLHGHHEDSSTWVLTKRQLNALTNKPGYKSFLGACLTTRTMLFIGISPDDVAVGGHLARMLRTAPDSGPHYWITNRRDIGTNEWAERHQVRIIRYRADNNDHAELEELFSDLKSFIPKDDEAPPVNIQTELFVDGGLPSPDELKEKDAETIRKLLNYQAKMLLSSDSDAAYSDFDEFCFKYDEAIYRAWYTSDQPGKNELLGYTLNKKEAKGAFGTVYRSTDPQGGQVAVKVLHEDIRENSAMLQSFRRGVKSMRILSDARVNGMVPYKDASEIPAFVVMDWVDGPNLHEAVAARFLEEWPERIKVALALAETIQSAHLLPQRVLHRDIRPLNIMLKGYYTDPVGYEVVLLDFDLSWHIGAEEKSVVYGTTTTGYLAPEQIKRNPKVSTRHAAVDSFGLGMTMYYIATGRDPYPTEHEHKEWRNNVVDACLKQKSSVWVSVPQRYARLVLNCTQTKQSFRWDVAQICGELNRLKAAVSTPAEVESSDMVAEEIIARSVYSNQYEWDENNIRAIVELPSSLRIILTANEAARTIDLAIEWASSGIFRHKNVAKWLPTAGDKIQSILKSNHWTIGQKQWGGEQISFSAHTSIKTALEKIDRNAKMIGDIGEALNFE